MFFGYTLANLPLIVRIKYGEAEFKQYIAGLIIVKLLNEYPQETKKSNVKKSIKLYLIKFFIGV
jgi:hypothetical protein